MLRVARGEIGARQQGAMRDLYVALSLIFEVEVNGGRTIYVNNNKKKNSNLNFVGHVSHRNGVEAHLNNGEAHVTPFCKLRWVLNCAKVHL